MKDGNVLIGRSFHVLTKIGTMSKRSFSIGSSPRSILEIYNSMQKEQHVVSTFVKFSRKILLLDMIDRIASKNSGVDYFFHMNIIYFHETKFFTPD